LSLTITLLLVERNTLEEVLSRSIEILVVLFVYDGRVSSTVLAGGPDVGSLAIVWHLVTSALLSSIIVSKYRDTLSFNFNGLVLVRSLISKDWRDIVRSHQTVHH